MILQLVDVAALGVIDADLPAGADELVARLFSVTWSLLAIYFIYDAVRLWHGKAAGHLLMLAIGGVGWLYGGIAGAVAFKLMYDVIANITPQYWTFWMGLFLVVLMLVGRERLLRPWRWFAGGQS